MWAEGLRAERVTDAARTAAIVLGAVVGGYAIAAGLPWWAIVGPPAIVALTLAPIEVPFLLSILAFNAAFSLIPTVGTDRSSALIGVLLASIVASRCLLSPVGRGQLLLGTLGVGALLFGVAVGVATDGLDHSRQVIAESLTFGGALLLLAPMDERAARRALLWTAIAAAAFSVLYVGTSVSGADLVPGVYERQGGSFLGVAIDRVYAPGGALALFGLLWAVAALAVRRGSRQGLWPIAAVCLVAVLFTLSRTLYMAAGCGVLVAILTAVTFRRGRARRMVVAFAVLFAIGGIALGPRLSQGVGEVRGGGGNLGTRIQGFNQRQAQIRDNALTGVGFSASSEGERRNAFSDSSAITFLVRFGLLGAALLAAVFVDTWRRAGRLARGGGDAGREVAALARGMIATVVVAAWTTEILTSPGAVPLLAAAVAAVHMAGASHGADRSAVGGSVPTETGDAVPG